MSTPTARDSGRDFSTREIDWGSRAGQAITGLSVFLILAILVVILGTIFVNGWPGISWRFVSTIPSKDFFEPGSAAVLPMIIGTTARVILMTIFVIPVGVITAIYLTEYAHTTSLSTRVIRSAVNNLAGVPSIVFGLFGAGFFIHFVGKNMDALLYGDAQKVWGHECLLWASMTLAVMTLPVVIVATEESLKAITPGLREASLALGATKLETIVRIVLPQALPGILTGGILAISRAAGEVAPILFTGASYFMADLPKSLSNQFMDLGYHVFILSTQSPDIEKTRPVLYATILVLLVLTFSLNLVATLVRANIRRRMRAAH